MTKDYNLYPAIYLDQNLPRLGDPFTMDPSLATKKAYSDDWLKFDSKTMGDYIEFSLSALDRVRFPPVLRKSDFVKRYSRGEFGNHSPTWNTLDEFLGEENLKGVFHLRSRIVGAETFYNKPWYEIKHLWERVSVPSQWYCSAMAPLHLLNVEIMASHEGGAGLYMFYSTVRKPMRDSLKEGGREAKGSAVPLILRQFMNDRSYNWLMILLDRYPGHVIEFTVVDRCWGTVPGFNTLFWEVRKY